MVFLEPREVTAFVKTRAALFVTPVYDSYYTPLNKYNFKDDVMNTTKLNTELSNLYRLVSQPSELDEFMEFERDEFDDIMPKV